MGWRSHLLFACNQHNCILYRHSLSSSVFLTLCLLWVVFIANCALFAYHIVILLIFCSCVENYYVVGQWRYWLLIGCSSSHANCPWIFYGIEKVNKDEWLDHGLSVCLTREGQRASDQKQLSYYQPCWSTDYVDRQKNTRSTRAHFWCLRSRAWPCEHGAFQSFSKPISTLQYSMKISVHQFGSQG